MTPLFAAAGGGHSAIVETLLAHGADIEAVSKMGQTAIFATLELRHLSTADVLLAHGADLGARDEDGWAPLDYAAEEGNATLVDALLARGAGVDLKDGDGWTPLLRAVSKNHVAAVEALISHGADTEVADNDGRTALLLAADRGHVNVSDALLARGADIEARDKDEWTPLLTAAANGHVAAVKALLSHGANIEAVDDIGSTALLIAAAGGHVAVLDALVARGADIEARDKGEWVALHWSAENGHVAAVEALIALGADVTVEDDFGLTALDVATDKDVRELLGVKLMLAGNKRPFKFEVDDTVYINPSWVFETLGMKPSRRRKGADDTHRSYHGVIQALSWALCAIFWWFPVGALGNSESLFVALLWGSAVNLVFTFVHGPTSPAVEANHFVVLAVAVVGLLYVVLRHWRTTRARAQAERATAELLRDSPLQEKKRAKGARGVARRGARPARRRDHAARAKVEKRPVPLPAAAESEPEPEPELEPEPEPAAAESKPEPEPEAEPEPEPAPEPEPEPEPAAEPQPEPAAAEPEAEPEPEPAAEPEPVPAPPSPPRDYEAAGAEESKGAEEVDPTVRALLASLGLSSYESTFAEHLVDAAALPLMTVEDFVEEMGIPVTVAVSIVEAMRAVSEASAKKLAVQEVFDDIARHQAVVEAELADHRAELERLRIRRDEVPESFACPITTELMKDPVFAADGHTYERCAIAQWFERAQTSPTTNEPIATNLVPNHAMKSMIAEFLDHSRALVGDP
jgi:ankyrin repeat protein